MTSIRKELCAFGLVFIAGISLNCDTRPSILAKKDELARFHPRRESLSDVPPVIKGKIAIVWRYATGRTKLDRFQDDKKFYKGPANQHSPFPSEVYAQTPEEIDTLIKVECRRFSGQARYTSSNEPMGSPGTLMTFNNTICDVYVIDYKRKTLLAKTTYGDEITPSVLNDSQYAQEVSRRVLSYLSELRYEAAVDGNKTT
jgi:hypothetical protein